MQYKHPIIASIVVSQNVKQLRKCPQVRWCDEIRNVAGIYCMTKVLEIKRWENLGKFQLLRD